MYILSLWFLFIFIIVLTIDVPICFFDCSLTSPDKLKELLLNNWISLVCLILLIIGIFAYKYFDFYIKGDRNIPFTIEKIETLNFENLIFLATYIIPLIGIDFEKARSPYIFFMLLLLMGGIYIKTDLFYTNPSLALLGFKIFKADGRFKNNEYRESIILISKTNIVLGDKVDYRQLDGRIYFVEKVV